MEFSVVAVRRARGRAANGFFALLAMTIGNAFGVWTIIALLPEFDVQLLWSDPARQPLQFRFILWATMAIVAFVCMIFAWRISRIAMFVGLAVLAVDWLDWAIGFFEWRKLSPIGFLARGAETVMLVLGISGANEFHHRKYMVNPVPPDRLYP